MADSEIVDRLLLGERSAFSEIVREHQKPLFYLALRWTRSQVEAEEMVQQTFVNAYTHLRSFQGKSSLRTWLYKIEINLLRNWSRYGRTRKMEDLDDSLADPGEGPDEIHILKDQSARILNAAASLKPRQKEALMLRLWEDLPFKEIARIMGGSENGAKVNYHYALQNLRDILKREGGLDGVLH